MTWKPPCPTQVFVGESPHYVAYWFGALSGAVAMGLVWRLVKKTTDPKDGRDPPKFPNEACKLALGAYCAAFAILVWYAHVGKEATEIINDGVYAKALKARHPITKLFGRKPKGY